MPASVRKSQRQPLSCTECCRRKLRCSKKIPCSSCIDRGKGDTCQREIVEVVKKLEGRARKSTASLPSPEHLDSTTPNTCNNRCTQPLINQGQIVAISDKDEDSILPRPNGRQSKLQSEPPEKGEILFRISGQAAITLEFLALGRKNILNLGGSEKRDQVTSYTHLDSSIVDPFGNAPSSGMPPWDLLVSLDQARRLITFHEEELGWMHNVVHLPTFRKQFETQLTFPSVTDKNWIALYYSILCTTLYHADETILEEMGIVATPLDVRALYDRAIQSLHDANFMAIHSIYAVQSICILLQVAHNLGESDFISVMLSAAIRISQCLNLHRLGFEKVNALPRTHDSLDSVQALVDREVEKRVWWFIVRQDWLQIPFQNTYSIHASQFNTPMPVNCFEDPEMMIRDGKIVVQPNDVPTQGSHTNVLNQISVTVWKQQEQMYATGHPGNSVDGLEKLYEKVLWADEELKRIWGETPSFLRDDGVPFPTDSPQLSQIRRDHLFSLAHKTFTIHRHFQLQSFRDKRFAYTQMACVSIAQRCLRDLEYWATNPTTNMSLKMWTVITHVISCSIIIVFAMIFSPEKSMIYDLADMRHLALVGRNTIRNMEGWSTIAQRGVKLIDALLDLEQAMARDQGIQFSVEDIIERVNADGALDMSSLAPDDEQGLFLRSTAWDDVMAFLGDIETGF